MIKTKSVGEEIKTRRPQLKSVARRRKSFGRRMLDFGGKIEPKFLSDWFNSDPPSGGKKGLQIDEDGHPLYIDEDGHPQYRKN